LLFVGAIFDLYIFSAALHSLHVFMLDRIALVKKPYVMGLIFLLFAAMSAVGLLAQSGVDDRGTPNNPATNPRANACYTGGSLAGTCQDFEWKWVCGWGIIRVEAGILFRHQLATECQALMPALEPTYTPQPRNEDDAPIVIPTLTKMPL
jgi:hypothetical protein